MSVQDALLGAARQSTPAAAPEVADADTGPAPPRAAPGPGAGAGSDGGAGGVVSADFMFGAPAAALVFPRAPGAPDPILVEIELLLSAQAPAPSGTPRARRPSSALGRAACG